MNNFTQRSRDRRTVSPLYQKMLMLLLLLVVGVSGAWAQTSLGKATMQSSSTTTIGDHDMDITGGITKALWYTPVVPTNHTTKEEKLFVKLWSDDAYIEIRFAKGSVAINDIVRVEISAFYSGNQTLGYKVDGNGDKVTQDVTDQAIYYIDQTLNSNNIKSGTGYDYIRISRNGLSGCAYHSVEILRPAGNVIKWTSGDIPSGCDAWYTLGDDATHHKESISGIASGTKVTLNATDAGNAHKIIDYWTFGKSSLYQNAAKREMTDWSHAVDGVLNLQPHFCDAYTMTAVKGDGCSSVSLKGTKDGNTTEINGIKQKSGDRYSLTFTATSEVGADFDGWYNGSSKISGENPYNYGEFSDGGTTDLTLTAKFKPANVVNVTVEPVGLTPEINIYFHEHHTGCIHGTGDNWGSIQNGKHIGDGTSIDVSVANVSGYNFVGWYENGVLKSTTQTDYSYGSVHNGCNLVAKFEAVSFDPALSLNGTSGGNVVSYTGGVLTVNGGSNNVICVKNNLTGHANDYTGIRLTTQGKACRLIVRWGSNDATERSIKVIDEADKQTTSYYSWSMLGVPQAKVSSISDIYFAGAQDYSYSESNTGVTTFSNASLVNVTETSPYTREIGEIREFNLNDTRVELYGHGDHYQMGDYSHNIQWVYKSETNGQKYVTMKTTETSNNMIEIFNSGHNIASYDGIHIDYKGQHFRVIAYKGDEKYVYTVPASTDKMTARFVTWKDLGITDRTGLTRIEVAGCSEHSGEESVNFYGIRLYKSLKDVIYTDESVTEGGYTGNLAYKENHDGNNMSVVFKNIGGGDRADDCQGTIVRKDDTHGFTLEAPGSHKITRVIVGLGENSTSKVLFNNDNNNTVDVNNKNQIEWENNATTSSVTMTIPSDAADVLHVKYVYYELEEIAIPSIDVNGQTRQYVVYAPDGITSSETSKVGVVFSLHGASNDYYNGRVDFNAIANAEKNVEGKKFVVVYPRGLMRQLRGTERGWETYTESNTEDVDFFKAVVEKLKETYKVDMNRIYLAGFSNGGMMAYKAAHQAGDFFKAFASVGGYPVNESHLFHAGSQPTPFIHIQGKADGIFPDATYPLNVVARNMMYRNGASFYPAGNGNGAIAHHDNIEEDCHKAQEGGAAYYMYKVTGMGHTWSYDWTGDGNDDVADAMWKFFNKDDIAKNVDKTLKFRIDAPGAFWDVITTGTTAGVYVGDIGFDNVNTGTSVLSYGGYTYKSENGNNTYEQSTNNKNLWHSLQFQGGINGAQHFLKLNVETEKVDDEDPNQFFHVKLTKTGSSTPVFAKRYQAGRGRKDLYINFSALPGFNEYKLEITKSSSSLVVKVHNIEFHSGNCQEFKIGEENDEPIYAQENPVFFYDVATELTGMKPIYQPVFQNSYQSIAKEYLPIADLPVGAVDYPNPVAACSGHPLKYKTIEDNLKTNSETPLTSIPSTLIKNWNGLTTATVDSSNKLFSLAISEKTDENTSNKSDNAFIFIPGGKTYNVDKVKGINISQYGRAEMPEYLNGTRQSFPTQGMIAIEVQGTVDFTLLAQNDVSYEADNANDGRRTLKVYYTNNQMDGELKELAEWWFFGTRHEGYLNDGKKSYIDEEGYHEDGNTLAPLSVNVRLPQLDKDGKCTLFITYEGDGRGQSFTDKEADHDKMWIKGFVIKRPDLKVTIGRTDSKYSGQTYNNENNTFCTHFGENKPYIWNFQNVGFNNTKNADIDEKKINKKDGRTYICGTDKDANGNIIDLDHLLVYSEITDAEQTTDPDAKAQFDGRKPGKEHIEFRKASRYDMTDAPIDENAPDAQRFLYDPVHSNGLKVNVTGSGWFKISCAAPNGPVKMKVYTQPNYGTQHISLLREFIVKPVADGDLKSGETKETAFRDYAVYFKARVPNKYKVGIDSGTGKEKLENGKLEGFWDGEPSEERDKADNAAEILRSSFFVVFDEIEGEGYIDSEDSKKRPQLNIHELSWLNEEPADYVFQREENPKLLNSLQSIISNGTAEEPGLYWQAGTELVEGQKSTSLRNVPRKETEYGYNRVNYDSAFDSANQQEQTNGQKSQYGAETTYYDGYEWNLAAKPHTVAHTEASKNKTFTDSETYKLANASSIREFASPISGSFFRFMPMKNQFISTWIVPESKDVKIFVLDETGSPIPFCQGADMNSEANKAKITQEAREHGWVHAASGMDYNDGEKCFILSNNEAKGVRIDFAALAAKEYFICSNGGMISLARLKATDNAGRANMETVAVDAEDYSLVLNDASNEDGNNTGRINAAMTSNKIAENNYARYATKVKFGRNIITGKWNPLVLPFSMNEEKFKKVFGDDAICLHFTSLDKDKKLITLTHHFYNMIVAGRPVFIRPSKTETEITDVTLQASTVTPTSCQDGWIFTGSFDKQTMKKNDLYMNNDNTLKYLTKESSALGSLRSYISSPSEGFGGFAKVVVLNYDEEDENLLTGIEELVAGEFGEDVMVVTNSTKVYDLNGRLVANGGDINNLPAGVYIVNGKKYVVK